ncbi:MAG: carboxypeptidase-like regulatory domain-containing protein [Planctomycetota bacterium]
MTDSAGRFTFPNPPIGTCRLTITDDPSPVESTMSVEIPEERPEAGLDLGDVRASRGDWYATGWVESPTGEPLPGIDVTCRQANGEAWARGTTGDAGRFWIGLDASTFGYASRTHPLSVRVYVQGSEPVEATVPGPPVRLVAQQGLRTTTFHFVDPDGAPLASGEVDFSYRSMRFGQPGWRLPIQHGEVQLDLPGGHVPPLTLLVRKARDGSDRAMLAGWVETLDVTGSELVEVRVPRGRTLRGSVKDPEGAAVSALRVSVRLGAAGKKSWGERVAYTDGDGRFELDGLPSVPLTLAPQSDAWLLEAAPSVTIPSDQGEVLLRVRRPRRLEVTVTGPDGAPLPNAWVRAQLVDDVDARPIASGRTNEAGMVTLHGLPHLPLLIACASGSATELAYRQTHPLRVEAGDTAHVVMELAASPEVAYWLRQAVWAHDGSSRSGGRRQR